MFPDFLRNIVNFAGQVGICSLELQRVDPDQNPNIAIGLDRRCDCAGGAGATTHSQCRTRHGAEQGDSPPCSRCGKSPFRQWFCRIPFESQDHWRHGYPVSKGGWRNVVCPRSNTEVGGTPCSTSVQEWCTLAASRDPGQ